MSVVSSDGGRQVTFSPERLDRLADALGASRIRPGEPLPALWHWTSFAPACVSGSSVRVRLFRAPRAGIPVRLETASGTDWMSTPSTLVQDG